MERAETSNFGFANAYLEDGIREINMMIEETVANAKTNLVADDVAGIKINLKTKSDVPEGRIAFKNVRIITDLECIN